MTLYSCTQGLAVQKVHTKYLLIGLLVETGKSIDAATTTALHDPDVIQYVYCGPVKSGRLVNVANTKVKNAASIFVHVTIQSNVHRIYLLEEALNAHSRAPVSFKALGVLLRIPCTMSRCI